MNKRIEHIIITIQPYEDTRGITELRVQVRANGQTYNTVQVVDHDDFTSKFDYMINMAKERIIELMKEQT